MHTLHIQASPGQLSKLRNGKSVRIRGAMEGQGFNLIVDPDTYHLASRAFAKDKGVEIKLSDQEISANKEQAPAMEGSGIFSKMKKGLSKAGSEIQKGAFAVNKALKSSPAARTIVKEVAPELAGMLAEAGATYVTGNPEVGKVAKMGVKKGTQAGLKSEGYGLSQPARGTHFGIQTKVPIRNLGKAGIGYADAEADNARLNADSFGARYKQAPAPYSALHGRGIHALNMAGRGTSVNGSASYMPQAIVPQPYSANFLMKNMLPPAYQRYNEGTTAPAGSGLYASGRAGHGLYV